MNELKYYQKLLKEYGDRFNDMFPTFEVALSMSEQIKVMEKCLKENKKYEIEIEEGVYY